MKWIGLLLAAACLLAGCAMSTQEKADLAAVQPKVPEALYDKILHHDVLSLDDIKTLAAHQVADGIVIRAIDYSGAVYHLHSKAIADLRQAGVGDAVIDALLKTQEDYYQQELDRERFLSPGADLPYPFPYYRR
jgi:hypothetical protein